MSETSQTSSENEKSKRPRETRKRQVHNEVERRRKDKINNWIVKISELLPDKSHKQSKISILEQTVDYIQDLVSERDKLLIEHSSEVQIQEVKKLKKELKLLKEQNSVYIKLLQQANINLSSLPKKIPKYSNRFSVENGSALLKQFNQESALRTSRASKHNTSNCDNRNMPQTEKHVNRRCNEFRKVAATDTEKVSEIIVTQSLPSTNANSNLQVSGAQNKVCASNFAISNSQNIMSTPQSILPAPVLCTSVLASVNALSTGAPRESQGSVLSYINTNSFQPRMTLAPGTGGIIQALPPFPVMSATHSSSVNGTCSKNIHMLIVPPTGNLMYPALTSQELTSTFPTIGSNAITKTVPVLVPQPETPQNNITSVCMNGNVLTLLSGHSVNSTQCLTSQVTVANDVPVTSVLSIASSDQSASVCSTSIINGQCSSAESVLALKSSTDGNESIVTSLNSSKSKQPDIISSMPLLHVTSACSSSFVSESTEQSITVSAESSQGKCVATSSVVESINGNNLLGTAVVCTEQSATSVSKKSDICPTNTESIMKVAKTRGSISSSTNLTREIVSPPTNVTREIVSPPTNVTREIVSPSSNCSLEKINLSDKASEELAFQGVNSILSTVNKNIAPPANAVAALAVSANISNKEQQSSTVPYSLQLLSANKIVLLANQPNKVGTNVSLLLHTHIESGKATSSTCSMTDTCAPLSSQQTDKFILQSQSDSIESSVSSTASSQLTCFNNIPSDSSINNVSSKMMNISSPMNSNQNDASNNLSQVLIISDIPVENIPINNHSSLVNTSLAKEHVKNKTSVELRSNQVLYKDQNLSLQNKASNGNNYSISDNVTFSNQLLVSGKQPKNCISCKNTMGTLNNHSCCHENQPTGNKTQLNESEYPNTEAFGNSLVTTVASTAATVITSCSDSQQEKAKNDVIIKDSLNAKMCHEAHGICLNECSSTVSICDHMSKTSLSVINSNKNLEVSNSISDLKQLSNKVRDDIKANCGIVQSINNSLNRKISETESVRVASNSPHSIVEKFPITQSENKDSAPLAANPSNISGQIVNISFNGNNHLLLNDTCENLSLPSTFFHSGQIISLGSPLLICQPTTNDRSILPGSSLNTDTGANLCSDKQTFTTTKYMPLPSLVLNSSSLSANLPAYPEVHKTSSILTLPLSPVMNVSLLSSSSTTCTTVTTEKANEYIISSEKSSAISKSNFIACYPTVVNKENHSSIQSTESNNKNHSSDVQNTIRLEKSKLKLPVLGPKRKIKSLKRSKSLPIAKSRNICKSVETNNNMSDITLKIPEPIHNSGISTLDTKNSDLTNSEQESQSFILSSDILAKATESIFCSNVLSTPISKETILCEPENDSTADTEHSMVTILDSAEEIDMPHEMSHINNSTNSDNNKENVNEKLSSVAAKVSEKEKTGNVCINILDNSLKLPENKVDNDGISNDSVVQELCSSRMRKLSAPEDGEPLSKKTKEDCSRNGKHDDCQNQSKQEEFLNVKASAAQDNSAIKSKPGTVESFKNLCRVNCHISRVQGESNSQPVTNICKQSSCNVMYSSPPPLSDIFKDPPHTVNSIESRSSSFTTFSENTTHLSLDEKNNAAAISCINSSGEENIQLPRLFLSATPQETSLSSACTSDIPFIPTHTTYSSECENLRNVTISMPNPETNCQDNLNKNSNLNSHIAKNGSKTVIPFSDSKDKANGNITKLLCSSADSQYEMVATDSMNDSAYLFTQPDNAMLNISPSVTTCTLSSAKPIGNRELQNTYTSVISSVALPPNANFYSGSSCVSQAQQNFLPSSPPPLLSRNYGCRNPIQTNQSLPYTIHSAENFNITPSVTQTVCSQTPLSAHAEALSHSLCSLLKDTSQQLPLGKNNGSDKNDIQVTSSSQSLSSVTAANISQSKYSALALISSQTFSEPSATAICTSTFPQSAAVVTSSLNQISLVTTTTSPSFCNRNLRTSLSYSAESLIQTQCTDPEKERNKNSVASNYSHFITNSNKKAENGQVPNIHDLNDTNIFMPLANTEISVQNMTMMPLPPVTSFPSFPSNYTMCDTVPPVGLLNSTVARAQDVSLPPLHGENSFLKHTNLSAESPLQSHNNRHVSHNIGVSPLTKAHPNISLTFENHSNLYNNCNFLQQTKTNMDNSRVTESSCFQPMPFNTGYSTSVQKQNCCHFSHQTVPNHSALITETNLSLLPTIPPFHEDKSDSHTNRPSIESNFSQNNTCYIGGNIFHEHSSSRDSSMGIKPSTIRTSQETFPPLEAKLNSHGHSTGMLLNQRKPLVGSKIKTKKSKQTCSTENTVNTNSVFNGNANMNLNFFSVSDISANKTNMSHVPNCYFKSSQQSILPASAPLQNQQNRNSEAIISTNSVMSSTPTFNPVLHHQSDSILNLNFQTPNFSMSPLSRAPPPPLSCSCLTSQVTTHTITTAPHPVPNFNLSNIFPDMGCSSSSSTDAITLSPIKFHPTNHILPPPPSTSTQCQSNSISANSSLLSRQTCGPSLYPPHPPIIHNTFSPLIGHSPHSLERSHAPIPGAVNNSVAPQPSPFVPSQPPPFRNVIHSLNFPRSNR